MQVPAGALKAWLRDDLEVSMRDSLLPFSRQCPAHTQEPLIPYARYGEAVMLGRAAGSQVLSS